MTPRRWMTAARAEPPPRNPAESLDCFGTTVLCQQVPWLPWKPRAQEIINVGAKKKRIILSRLCLPSTDLMIYHGVPISLQAAGRFLMRNEWCSDAHVSIEGQALPKRTPHCAPESGLWCPRYSAIVTKNFHESQPRCSLFGSCMEIFKTNLKNHGLQVYKLAPLISWYLDWSK